MGLGRSVALPSGVRPPYMRAAGLAPAFRRSSSTSDAWASTAKCRGLRPHVGSCGVQQGGQRRPCPILGATPAISFPWGNSLVC